jgi:hypothetical protein
MSLDTVREWVLWFGNLIGVTTDLPPQVQEIEMVDLATVKPKKPEVPSEIELMKAEMVELRKNLEDAAGGGKKRLEKLQNLAVTADSAITTNDVTTAREAVDALKTEMDKRPPANGERSGKTDGELVEAWNSKNERYEFHHPDEWQRLVERKGGGTMEGGSTPMVQLKKSTAKYVYDEQEKKLKAVGDPNDASNVTGVFIQQNANQFIGTFETHLRWERESTTKVRAGMTDNVNNREGKAQQDVKNNCGMASKLADVIKAKPELLNEGGLLNRIVGQIEGQGQFKREKDDTVDVDKLLTEIKDASDRLAAGKGEADDANKVMQLIGCFTDGLTEVVEYKNGDKNKKTASDQFDDVWPTFMQAFNLKEDDKEKLLARVDGYKEIAGGVADTMSGKGTRKGKTRNERAMPDDPRYKIEDQDALIRNDISGSMHSSLLAQELSESLQGGGIKGKGDSVLVKDKGALDARAYDALAITAGGIDNSEKGKGQDSVLHTAWEMINGMRAVSGAPEVDEAGASYIIRQMGKGVSFTAAMEDLFKPEQLPWLNGEGGEGGEGGKDAGEQAPPDPAAKLKKQMAACEYRLSKEMDGSKFRPTDILDIVSYTTSETKEFEKSLAGLGNTPAKTELQGKIDAIKELQQLFAQSAMVRAIQAIQGQLAALTDTLTTVTPATQGEVAPALRKKLYESTNAALVKADGQINDWTTQISEGKGLPGLKELEGPLGEMIKAHQALEGLMPKLLPQLKGKPARDDGTTTNQPPEEMVIKDEKDAERILIECKDWSEAKRRYAQYKTEMQKLADFRQKVVDGWLNANLRDIYGLKEGANEGWVSVGSKDPTSDYDISINKHSFNEDGTVRKYDYEMVEEFNKHFRGRYGCETGTIFDTNLYASAPNVELAPREDEREEEKHARENIKASNDIGALMKQRRYMSAAEFNDYKNSVVDGLEGDAQLEVWRRFEQADANYRIALQKTVEVLAKVVADNVKHLEAEGEHEEEIKELNELLKREQDIRSASGSDLIGAADALEQLAHDLEHACKNSNTQATNDLYTGAKKDMRQVEGKIAGLQACMTSADKLVEASKALASLPENASEEERQKLAESVTRLKGELADAVGKLNDTRLAKVPKAIEEDRLYDAASALASLAPELYEDLGRAMTLSMFFANEAYQSGGPFKHVVHAGQAVDSDVREGAAKADNDQKKDEESKKKQLEEELTTIMTALAANKTATEQPGADQGALQAERDELTKRFGELTDEVTEQDKKIKDLEGKIQAAISAERTKRRKELAPEECLDSFNEQLGDFLKDLAHYGDADPGVAIIQSSKYLDRMLDAASLIHERGLIVDEQLVKEVETQIGRIKTVQDQLIKARKGQIKIEPDEGVAPFTPEEELEQRRALACEIMKGWGINSVASLHRTYADLGKKLNIEARKTMASAG